MTTATAIHTGFRQEVGDHTPDLQARLLDNPIACWVARFREADNRHPIPEMHLDLYDIIMRELRAAIMCPRSFAKSTIAIVNFSLYLCCEHEELKAAYKLWESHGIGKPPIFPHTYIMICSATGTEARDWLQKISEELTTNANILETYGDLRHPTMPWNQDVIHLSNGVKIRAVGAGYKLRGKRPTLFIGDDLDDDEEARNPEQVQKRIEWWDKAVTGMLDEVECQMFIIGTPIEEETLLGYICEKPNWAVFHYGAYEKDEFGEFIREKGYETWPSKWSHERLVAEEADIKERAFRSEYLCDPPSSENPIMERHWFQTYDPDGETFLKLMDSMSAYTACGGDPAVSLKDKNDYNALVTVTALGSNPVRFFIRTHGVKQGHWSPTRMVTETFRMYDTFYANEVGIEAVAYQRVLCILIDDYMDANQRSMTVRPLFPDGDKERRTSAVAPLVERGCVFYDPNDPMHIKLINQCVRFKRGVKNVKKDLMDAFVYALAMCDQETRNRKGGGAKRVLPKGSKHSPYTGVIK